MKLTVYHDGQYWIGVVEEEVQGKLKTCRQIFGPEPQNEEILHFVNNDLLNLLNRSSQYVEIKEAEEKYLNPKRLARQAAKEVKKIGISTQAQLALQLERESNKKERKILTRQQKEERKERVRQLKVKKNKAKHRGR